MSQENVEAFRKVIKAINERGPGSAWSGHAVVLCQGQMR